MARVMPLENFYERRLLSAVRQLRIDDCSKPATGYSCTGDGHPGRFRARARGQGEPSPERVNGKPVNMPRIRWAWRVIADRAFAVFGLTRPRRKFPLRNI